MGINEELEQYHRDRQAKGDPLPSAELRPYQHELSEIAIKENSIVFLGTGCGKTFISVMLISSADISSQVAYENRRIAFLAPTQDLTKQQAEYLQKHTRYKCKVYMGSSARSGKNIDYWDRSIWDKEFEQIQVAVMTAQIFANAISTNILEWEKFAAVIFDEGHHVASKKKNKASGHAYAQIMRHYGLYYATRSSIHPRPRLLILTASLLNSMPKNRDSIHEQICFLESTFQAKCRTNLEIQNSLPRFLLFGYDCDPITPLNDTLVSVLNLIKNRLTEILCIKKARLAKVKVGQLSSEEISMLQYQRRLKLSAAGFTIKPKQFPDILEGLIKIRTKLGLWTLHELMKLFIAQSNKVNGLIIKEKDLIICYKHFVNILNIIRQKIEMALLPTGNQYDITHLLIGTSDVKMRALLDLLSREYNRSEASQEKFSAIVFIKSRLETVGLVSWLKKVSQHCQGYEFIKVDYAVGMAGSRSSKYSSVTQRSPEDQMATLKRFRASELNVLLTTSVLEEGIDLPICSTVIRYDGANNLREYIQSRGRARKSMSSYICLTETGRNMTVTSDKLNMFHDMEMTLIDYFKKDRDAPIVSRDENMETESSVEEDSEFFQPNDKVCITLSMAPTLLSMYFYYSAKGAPYIPKPQVMRKLIREKPKEIQSTLYLPSGCLIRQGIKGNVKSNIKDADLSASLNAIIKLHELKEIDENCVPYRLTPKNMNIELLKLEVLPDEVISKLSRKAESLEEASSRREFTPNMRKIPMVLSNNTMHKTYSIFGVKYIPLNVRDEIVEYFKPIVLGIVSDISIHEMKKVMPPNVYNHYGKFELHVVELTNELVLNFRDHNYYLDFMLRYLRRCLGMKNLNMTSLSQHCPLYIVPLKPNAENIQSGNPRSFIDESMMKNSYKYEDSQRRVQQNHIVILARRLRDRSQNFFIVDRVLSDVKPNHRHIDINTGESFADYARRTYNLNHVRSNQCVVRVRPLSKEVANLKDGKKCKLDYRSRHLHFLEETIEFLHSDPYFHLQSFLIPPVMYRVFQIKATQLVVDDITSKLEETKINTEDGTSHDPIEVDDDPLEHDNGQNIEMLDCNDNDLDGNESLDEFSDSDVCDDSDNYDSSDDDEEQHNHLRLDNIQDDDYGRDFFPWERNDYEAVNCKNLKCSTEFHSISMFYAYRDKFSHFDEAMMELPNEVAPALDDLTSALVELQSKLSTDQDLDDDDDTPDDTSKVDRSIAPKMKFDTFTPKIDQTRIEPILRALTLRKAQDLFDLERLENVGDSFLKLVTSIVLYNRLDGKEGLLSQLRSSLVCNQTLCELASRRGLGDLAVTRSCDVKYLNYLFGADLPSGDMDNRLKDKDLADMFEAIVGAQLVHFGNVEAIKTLNWLGLKLLSDEELRTMDKNQKITIKSSKKNLLDEEQARHLKKLTSRVRDFQGIIGYKFTDKSLLVQAFTHPTCISNKTTRSYQRLEFLGDAILDYLVTRHIYDDNDNLKPGQITDIRSALVNNYTFARLALKYKFDLYLMYDQQSLLDELTRIRTCVSEFNEANLEIGFESLLEFDEIVKLLADIFEAVAGAIYLDSGSSLDSVWSIYYPMMKEIIEKELREPTKNPIREISELFPAPGTVSYVKVPPKGNEIRRIALCKINGLGEFKGVGHTYRDAKLRASCKALKQLPSAERIAEINQQQRTVTRIDPPRSKDFQRRSFKESRSTTQRRNHVESINSTSRYRNIDHRSSSRSSDGNWRRRN